MPGEEPLSSPMALLDRETSKFVERMCHLQLHPPGKRSTQGWFELRHNGKKKRPLGAA